LEVGVHLLRNDRRQLAVRLREIGQKSLDVPASIAAGTARSQPVALLGDDKIVHFLFI